VERVTRGSGWVGLGLVGSNKLRSSVGRVQLQWPSGSLWDLDHLQVELSVGRIQIMCVRLGYFQNN